MTIIDVSLVPNRREPLCVMMCTPDHFDIVDVKNIHMEGHLGDVDKALAIQQWHSIFEIYQYEVNIGNITSITSIEGDKDCEDMVFCANQSFPWIDHDDEPVVVMSRMKHASRQREVETFEMYYDFKDYQIFDAPGEGLIEGMGDLIPMPGKRMIFGGYGHRTEYKTLLDIHETLDTDLVTLELISDSFYHLDTCFIPLDQETVLIAPEAFSEESLKKIHIYFKEVIEIPYHESAIHFALNAHVVTGKKYKFAIIQEGNPYTVDVLTKKGYKVYEVDTSEFIKSGGSVFCMKMMYYENFSKSDEEE